MPPVREKGRGRRRTGNNLRRVKKARTDNKLSNTERRNKVVEKDLKFWLPLIKEENLKVEARKKVPLVKTLPEFWKLKPVYQAHLLVGFIKIYRKGRNPGGDMYPNCTLWDVASVIKRIGEAHYSSLYNAEMLDNENACKRSFDLFDDERFQVFIDALNEQMVLSANEGLNSGLKKKLRDRVKPEYLKKVFELPWETVPVYLEYVNVLLIMLLLAI